MNITFEHGTSAGFDHILKTTSTDGTEIEIGFNGFDAKIIYISGHEMEVSSDDYKGLYLNFGRGLEMKFIPVATVIQQANAQIEDIVSEIETEAANWDRHAQSFSQPSL